MQVRACVHPCLRVCVCMPVDHDCRELGVCACACIHVCLYAHLWGKSEVCVRSSRWRRRRRGKSRNREVKGNFSGSRCFVTPVKGLCLSPTYSLFCRFALSSPLQYKIIRGLARRRAPSDPCPAHRPLGCSAEGWGWTRGTSPLTALWGACGG